MAAGSLLGGLFGSRVRAAEATTSVHDTVARLVADHTVPGAIVLLRRDGRDVLVDAQGIADGMPLRADTVFWVASMTKPVVATTVMMLVDEGKIRLTDPLSKYIPEFAKPRQVRSLKAGSALPAGGPTGANAPPPEWTFAPAVRPLTVRDMITMTGGLQTIGVPNSAIPAYEDTIATWVPRLADAPLDFQPGSRWAYSNATEFDVLVRVVEVASGMGYADFVQRRVFDPLEMKDSHFGRREDLKTRTAPLGNLESNPLVGGRFTSGSAGLFTTAHDYANFAEMLLGSGAWRGRRLLRPETVRAMSSNEIGDLSLAGVNASVYGRLPDKTNPAIKYGYGMLVLENPQLAGVPVPQGSFGWDGVGTRRFWVMPKLNAVLVMLVPGGQADVLHRAVEEAVVGQLKG